MKTFRILLALALLALVGCQYGNYNAQHTRIVIYVQPLDPESMK